MRVSAPQECGTMIDARDSSHEALGAVQGRSHFLSAGLQSGEAGIVIATPPHRAGLEQRLNAIHGFARKNGTDLLLCVRDDGFGLTAELRERVFEPFVQAQSSHRSRGGLGIGLTLVRSLVTLHGGTIEARSDGPGRGSEFVVCLPISVVAS